jgi:hypothetical protein
VIRTVIIGLAFALTAGGVRAADETPVPRTKLAQLAWLTGSWAFEVNGRAVTEQWMAPDGGMMLGMSRTVVRGRAVDFEFLVLREDAHGDIYYDARPSGQEPASFKLVHLAPNEVTFENPAHDFPQRITYRLSEGGKLDAAIEGTKNGKTMRAEFPYQRVPAN